MNVLPPSGAGAAGGGELRRVLERFDIGVVVRRMEDGFGRLPACTGFEWPVDRTAVVRWNVDFVLCWMVNGIPPDSYLRSELHEFLRARAVAGQPIEDSILVYRRGARMFWEALLDLAGDEDRAVLVAEWEPYRPFAARLAGAAVASHADLASRLRTAGALAFTEGVRVTGLTPSGFGWEAFLEDPRLILAQDPPLARDRLGAAVDGLRALLATAARSGRRGRGRADDYLPELLLADSPEASDRIVRRVFGPLERAEAVDLADTLRCLAVHGFDSTAAAAALPVHRNTLLYRMGRIEKLSGLSLKDQAGPRPRAARRHLGNRRPGHTAGLGAAGRLRLVAVSTSCYEGATSVTLSRRRAARGFPAAVSTVRPMAVVVDVPHCDRGAVARRHWR
ncbi:putative transcriptional regulator, PucR family [Actinobacteria bacterium OK074]|nr:putative transcriptional regulator, PucR family [Actinobacteria bacterium OK074]